MRPTLCFLILLLTTTHVCSQQAQTIRYGYNARGEINLIIENTDTLFSFYDASGNRITESQNVYSIEDKEDPTGDEFLSCYPNPSPNIITVSFLLPRTLDYQITLFNQSGQFVRTLYTGQDEVGRCEISVSVDDLGSGTYFIWFRSREISKVKKIIKI